MNKNGFFPHRSCLSNYLPRDECVTHLMDEENSVHFVYLDIAKTFDAGTYRFLSAKLKSVYIDLNGFSITDLGFLSHQKYAQFVTLT